MTERHRHRWVRNLEDHSQRPVFACNRLMWTGYRASVTCVICRCRTWVTREEWARDRADDAPVNVLVRHPHDGSQREAWRGQPGDAVEAW